MPADAIRVYTTPTCGYCRQVKTWLDEQDCPYQELDITADVESLREWRALTGGVGVPVVAHGKDFVIGFNRDRLTQLLDCAEHSTAVSVSDEQTTRASVER